MEVFDFVNNPDWHTAENMAKFFEWATSPEIEQSGEGRRQLGYLDGYNGDPPGSCNADYLKGYEQGTAMREVKL